MSSLPAPLTEKPWHHHLTIDLLAHVLSRSILHPYIAWLIPLCLRAVATPYHHPEFIFACVWASLVTLSAILSVVNKRVAYGRPREVDWDEEVVVITGGASGLGKVLVQMFGMRGASVAVLDVKQPEKESEGLAGVRFYECDVGDAAAVEKAKGEIEKDVCSPYQPLPLRSLVLYKADVADGKSPPSSAHPQSSSTTPESSTASPSSHSHQHKSNAASPSTSSPTSIPSVPSSQACSLQRQAAQSLP